MFMQQLPKPAADRWVPVEECERTSTSAPLNTPASYMVVFASGAPTSSAGVPYTVTVPAVLELDRNSATATAAAMPTGPWALCWSPWKSRRSEEHTSELQSQSNLVCRLLLEKKKSFIAPAVT